MFFTIFAKILVCYGIAFGKIILTRSCTKMLASLVRRELLCKKLKSDS